MQKGQGKKCARLNLDYRSATNTLNWIRISSRAVDRCDIYISFDFDRCAENGGEKDSQAGRRAGYFEIAS